MGWRWPWASADSPAETRQTNSYSDTLIAALLARAQGKTLAIPSTTAALESCAGAVGRAFAAAEVSGRPAITNVLTPSCLELIGRSLIRRGEAVFLIDVDGAGSLRLLPADSWDVEGNPQPETWWYRVTVGGPSGTLTWPYVPAAGVLHFRYAVEASGPWRSNGPVQVASLAGKLSAETINALANEASGPVGRLLGIPVDGDDSNVDGLKSDIGAAAGRMVAVETGDWNASTGGMVDLKTARFGAEPSRALIEQAKLASAEVMSACGFNPALFQAGDAASLREAWRLGLFGVIAPLGRLVQSEIMEKLDSGVSLSWQELRASDLSGRARAFQSMVGGGMDVSQAVAVAGLMAPDE